MKKTPKQFAIALFEATVGKNKTEVSRAVLNFVKLLERENKIGWHKKIIVEAETPETINLEETREQFIAFSGSYGEFHVIVPEGYISSMQTQAQRWNVKVDKYWEMKL